MKDDLCELLCLDLEQAEAIRSKAPQAERAAELSEMASALGDPTRVLLALALRDGDELCVCDLSWIVQRSQSLVSHHLRMMRAARLADSRRDGKMVLYSLSDSGRRLIDLLASEPAAA